MGSKVIPLGLNQVGRHMLRPGGRRRGKGKGGRMEDEGRQESKGRRRMFGGDGGEGRGEIER